jgi:hypothetical protein
MPRARLLKPGFFKNEDLAGLPFEDRLCYAGLWTIADRQGRLTDKPQRIKAELFPYDQLDIEKVLNDLVAHRFIVRYQTNGELYIAIPTFLRHQNPHIKEPDSAIPAPPKKHKTGTGPAQGENHAGTGLEPDQNQFDPAVYSVRSLDPVPESGSGVRSLDPESACATRAPDPESVAPSAPLRGASPPKGGEPPLRGSRKTKRNLAAMERAVAHIRSRGRK